MGGNFRQTLGVWRWSLHCSCWHCFFLLSQVAFASLLFAPAIACGDIHVHVHWGKNCLGLGGWSLVWSNYCKLTSSLLLGFLDHLLWFIIPSITYHMKDDVEGSKPRLYWTTVHCLLNFYAQKDIWGNICEVEVFVTADSSIKYSSYVSDPINATSRVCRKIVTWKRITWKNWNLE